MLSLKHNTPSDFSVVLDTYTENPINRGAKPLFESENSQNRIKICSDSRIFWLGCYHKNVFMEGNILFNFDSSFLRRKYYLIWFHKIKKWLAVDKNIMLSCLLLSYNTFFLQTLHYYLMFSLIQQSTSNPQLYMHL